MTVLPRDHPWTVDDLDALPEDGLRYELVDGMLLVSPAPNIAHQRCQAQLFRLIDPLVPVGFELFLAPTDYRPTMSRSLQPDLLVVTRHDLGPVAVTAPLLLAVEIVSPSSRSVDMLLKRGLYEEAGVEHYWVADPELRRLLVWSRTSAGFGEPRVCDNARPLTITAPIAITLDAVNVFGEGH